MADWKFYKKSSPDNSPVLANGAKVKFSTLDFVVGYYATDNQYVQDELARLMGEGRYGMNEISSSEWDADYIEKKKALNGRAIKPPWREEVKPRDMSTDTVMATESRPRNQSPSAVAAAVEPAQVAAVETQAIPVKETTTTFKPPVAKRGKSAAAKK